MRKSTFQFQLFLIMVFAALKTTAQCNVAIPANANVVDSTQQVNGGFTPQWICDADTLNSGGGIFNIYAEPGAVVNLSGGIDSVWVKNGATLFITGGSHHVMMEPLATVISFGGSTIDTCATINYNYLNAPANGCLVTSISAQTNSKAEIRIIKDEFTENILIQFPQGNFSDLKFRMFDISGKEIQVNQRMLYSSGYPTIEIKRGDLCSGIYLLKAGGSKQEVNEKLLIE
jgi:hypothetical protein